MYTHIRAYIYAYTWMYIYAYTRVYVHACIRIRVYKHHVNIAILSICEQVAHTDAMVIWGVCKPSVH